MTLTEAIKQIKALKIKADDLKRKVSLNCANLDIENPIYGENQMQTVQGWIQAYVDICHEISRLKVAISRTNLTTEVTIELQGKSITKSIAEWVLRRRELAAMELQVWNALTDRGLHDGKMTQSDQVVRDVKVRRYFEPNLRDEKIEALKVEPLLIDAKLEVANAKTDLIE